MRCGCTGSGGAPLTDSSEIIASVNHRADFNQYIPPDRNARSISALQEPIDAEIVPVEAVEFYETYRNTDIEKAEEVAGRLFLSPGRGV